MLLLLPLFRFRNKYSEQEGQQSWSHPHDHQQTPGAVPHQAVGLRYGHSDGQQPVLDGSGDLIHHQSQESDQQISHIRRGTDQTCHQSPRTVRPDLHHQGHPQRPFAPHTESSNKPQDRDLPGRCRKTAQTGEKRIGDDTQRHGPHAANSVTQPAEQNAARRSPHQKHRRDHTEEECHLLRFGSSRRPRHAQQFADRGSPDQGEQPHFGPIKQPAEQCGSQCHPFSGTGFRGRRIHETSQAFVAEVVSQTENNPDVQSPDRIKQALCHSAIRNARQTAIDERIFCVE